MSHEPIISEQRINDLVNLVVNGKFKISILEKEPRTVKKVVKNAEVVEETKEFKNTFTEFIISELVKTPQQTSNFLKLVYGTFDSALKVYTLSKKLPENSVLFLYKGGNILRLIFQEITKELPFSVSEKIEDYYKDSFKKSDADFSIYINPNISNYDSIYNEICDLTFLIENQIRNEFIQNKSFYFEYFRLSPETQKSILASYVNKLNESGTVKDKKYGYDGKFTGIIFGDTKFGTDEEYVTKDDSQIAFVDRKTQLENYSVKLTYLHNIRTSDPSLNQLIAEQKPLYTKNSGMFTSANEITFEINNRITFFNLIRTKWSVDAIFDYNNKPDEPEVVSDVKELRGGTQKLIKSDGELIDVSIIGKEDFYVSHFFEHLNENIANYHIETGLSFKAYSFTYLIADLEKILFLGSEFPWIDTKYAKRIRRLLFMYFLLIIINFPAEKCNSTKDIRIDYIKNIKIIFDKIIAGSIDETKAMAGKYLQDSVNKQQSVKMDPCKELIKNLGLLLLNPKTDKDELVKYSTVVSENLGKMLEILDSLNNFIKTSGKITEEQLLNAQVISGGNPDWQRKYYKYKNKLKHFRTLNI
jgi:hypothetical protein